MRLPLSSLIEGKGRGYMRLDYPGEACLLPAQALISNGSGAFSIELRDDRELRNAPPRRHALVPVRPRGGSAARLILTNLDGKAQGGAILSQGRGGAAKERRWLLGAGETAVFDYPAPPSGRPGDESGIGPISVAPDDPSAQVIAHGYLELPGGGLLPLHFQPEPARPSGEMAGFHSGTDSHLQIWNRSDRTADIEIEAIDSNGERYALRESIEASSTLDIPLRALEGLPEGSEGALLVRSPEGVSLLGQVLGLKGGPTLTALRDTGLEAGEAYSLPATLAEGMNTRIKLFNPGQATQEVCVFVNFGREAYTYPLKTLGAGEYAEVDLLQARREGLPGEAGGLLPEGDETGQVRIVHHSEEGSSPAKGLVVMGLIDGPSPTVSATFQGCTACPPLLSGLRIVPGSFSGLEGGRLPFEVRAEFDEGLFSKAVTSRVNPRTDRPSVATANGGELQLHSAGFTNLEATFSDCVAVEVSSPDMFDEGGGAELICRCLEHATLMVTAPVQVFAPPCVLSNLRATSRDNFRISTAPAMPQIDASVAVNLPGAPVSWTAQVLFENNRSCGGGPSFDSPAATGSGTAFSPSWQARFGGALLITARYQASTLNETFTIDAEDPGKAAIQAQIGNASAPFGPEDLKRIACQESRQRQFGDDRFPVFGPGGDAGIFQICFLRTTPDLWDWKQNIARGKAILNAALAFADLMPARVRTRRVRGLGPFPNATDFTDHQRRLEAIHRYNAGTRINEGYWQWDNNANEWRPVPLGGIGGYVDAVLAKSPSCP